MQGPVEGYVEKCLCIVSRMACIRTFKRYLTTLYSTFRGNGFTPELPIESYLAHLVQVPIPPPGRIALSLVLPGQSQLQVFAPTILDFPLLDFPLHILFQSLDLENVLKLLMCVMLEKKILLVSKRLSLLSLAAEGICCILWPFMWRMTYVPLLNRDLFIYTEAPAPFIMGAHSSMVSGKLDWVTIVDLDRNAVQIADPIPDFPAGPKKRLIDTLIDHIHPTLSELDNAFPREDEDRENHEQHIRAQFLIFYGELFGWFNHTAADQPTEEQAFIASRLPDESDFYNQMFATETWTSFSEDRRRDREDLFHQFLHQFYPISRSRTRPLHISLPAEIASSATTSNGPVTHSHGRARSVNETNRSRPDNSVLTGSGRNRKDENGSVPIARSRTPDNAAERINPPSESEREAAEEKCFIEQLEFLLKHFSKPDSVFATSAPKPVTISEVKPSKEGSPAVSRSEQPDRDQSSRERAAFLAAPVIAVKRPNAGTQASELPLFPKLREDIFSQAFDVRCLQDMISRLSPLVEESPEIIQYYCLRAALYAETQQYVLAVKDYERIWSLMYGFNRFIAANEEIMLDLLKRLPSDELAHPDGLGEYPKGLIEQYLLPHSPRQKSSTVEDSLDLPSSPRSAVPSKPASLVTIVSPAPSLYSLEDGKQWELEIDIGKMLDNLPQDKVLTQQQFEEFVLFVDISTDWADSEKLWESVARSGMNRVHTQKLSRLIKQVQAHYAASQSTTWTNVFQHGEVVLRTSNTSVTNTIGQRGHVILTNHRILFAVKKLEAITEYCKLEDITGVERFNYKILIPPGLPCIKISTKKQETETFCFLSWVERDIWMSYLNELKGAYDISIFLDSPIIIPLAAHRIVLTESLSKLKRKHTRTLFRFIEMSNLRQHRIRQRLLERGVLNMKYECENSRPRHACKIVESLFESLTRQFYENLCEDGREVRLNPFVNSSEFKNFERASAELQTADLTRLDEDERMAFFINVFNILTMHGCVIGGIPAQAVEWRYFCRAAYYNIGGYDYSLDAIYHGVLRGNQATPFTAHLPFGTGDPRLPFVIQQLRPQVHFTLAHHFRSSPFLRFYRAFAEEGGPNLTQALLIATQEYLAATVNVHVKESEVVLSELLRWYRCDFKFDDESEFVEQCVLRYLSGSKHKALQQVLHDNDFTVSYEFSWDPEPQPFRQL
eukprot:TRINITY_DN3830_c0_g1_i3.p1 TRINITY_DN3830_c0_g1~~TRINITY_DN3830_c0_g1_i3.p1  ORF type:complete len:1328 (+),score=123.48 TRINITY_DN3830_c0_g1_i3:443-3985(+)